MNYSFVISMELANPELFEDADITNNLCICELYSGNGNYKDYRDLETMKPYIDD